MACPDPNRLFSASTETRREFLISKVAAGFALAMYPLTGQTITTDASGLTVGDVKIPVIDGTIPGYRACSSKSGSYPVVVVVTEIFGVQEQIKDICRRFAKVGYCAVAPDLFARQGDVSKMTEAQITDTVLPKVSDAQVMSDLDAAIDWAVRNSKGSSSRAGVVGYDWGGRIAWLYSALSPKVKAGVAFYGQLEGNKTPLTPKQPLDYAGGFKIPVLGFYGGKDTSIPAESVQKMKLSLDIVESPAELVIYPNAQHGFFADNRPTYSKADAEDAWKKTLVCLKLGGV